jgi:hypothetical protein
MGLMDAAPTSKLRHFISRIVFQIINPCEVTSPEKIQGPIPALTSDPVVIPVGGGTTAYGACGETLAINAALLSAGKAADSLEEKLTAKKAELDRAAGAGNSAEYRRLLSEYNALVREFNGKAEVNNYLLQHLHDRPGTYRWLQVRGLVASRSPS